MKLYSYILPTDTGFAPNPYWGVCTLATCKPRIRKSAQKNDWIIGTGSVKFGKKKLIYAMKISEVLSLDDYFHSTKFKAKKPKPNGSYQERCGDNIYYKNNGVWGQTHGSFHNKTHIRKDIEGENVLIGEQFYYFGNNAIIIPSEFEVLIFGRQGYKTNHPDIIVSKFIKWLESNNEPGIYGVPNHKFNCNGVNIDCNSNSLEIHCS